MMSSGGRLSLLYAAMFFELGVNLPFFPVWLRAQALDDAAIGLILAAPLVARILANPVVAAFADQNNRLAGALVACSLAVVAGTVLLGFATSFGPILVLVIAIALGQGPFIALADALTMGALKVTAAKDLDYGRIRLWGSIAFAVANLSAGFLLVWLPPASIVAMLALSALATAAAAVAVARLPLIGAARAVRHGSSRLDHPWLLGLVIAGAACVQASHAFLYAFSTLQWQSDGYTTGSIGALFAMSVVGEVALFGLAGRFLTGGATHAMAMLILGASIAAIRWFAMAAEPDTGLLVLFQISHGLTFGATHLGSIHVVSHLVPPDMRAQAQSWLAATWAGLMALLTTLSGNLYPSWGPGLYGLMAAVAAGGLVLLGIAAWRMRNTMTPGGRSAAW